MNLKRMLLSPDTPSSSIDINTSELCHKFRQVVIAILSRNEIGDDVEVHMPLNVDNFRALESKHANDSTFVSSTIGVQPVSVSFIPKDDTHRNNKMVVTCIRNDLEELIYGADSSISDDVMSSILPANMIPSVA